MLTEPSYFFEEGQVYQFIIKGEVELPPDNERFLILISPLNSKHLLKTEPYEQYKLEVGSTVLCRIDKINCAGKIFLEPEHPVYKEGQVYDFEVRRKYSITNSEGNIEQVLVLNDCFNQEFIIHRDEEIESTSIQVQYKVDRLKKGKLYLSLPNETEEPIADLIVGKKYAFVVKDLMMRADDEEYYSLLDAQGHTHFLRKKYYKDYGFEMDKEIICTVVSTPLKFRHYLEPEHPRYKKGVEYDFIVSGIESYIDVFGKEVTLIKVNDGSEKEYFVQGAASNIAGIEVGSVIRCLLTDIRLSRLRLVCVG